jgi:hypothetical protein
MADYEYIWYGNKGEKMIIQKKHVNLFITNAQIDNFTVNQTLTGSFANFSGTVTAPNFNGLASNATTAKSIGGAFDAPHLTKPGKELDT